MAALVAAMAMASGASATFVYVSNQGAGTMSVFSTQSNGSLSPVAVEPAAAAKEAPNNIAIAPNARFLYVNDVNNDQVVPYRINTDGTLTAISCSSSNCATGSNPYYGTVSPNGRFLYVSNYGTGSSAGTISVYSIGSDGSLTAVACATCQTGIAPGQLSITPNGKFLYVPNYGDGTNPSTVSVFSVNSDGSLTPVVCSTGCVTPAGPETSDITPNGKYLYVANYAADSVSVYAIGSGGTLTPISCSTCATGSSPNSLSVGPDGDHLYVANAGSDSISPFTIGSDGALSPISCSGSDCQAGPGGAFVAALNPAGTFLYALNGSTISVFAVGTSSSPIPVSCPSADCSTGSGPNDLVVTPDQAPKAAFVAKPAHAHHFTKLDGSASSAAPGQTVVSWDWNFGDGQKLNGAGPKVSKEYAKPGRYKVTLTVTDDAGCSTALIYTGAQTLCNGGPSARVSHIVTIPPWASRLTVRPRTAQAGRRTCFTFHFTSSGHGLRAARVRFAGHSARTGSRGGATICLSLNRGRYTARATKAEYRTSTAAVRITAAAPAFTG